MADNRRAILLGGGLVVVVIVVWVMRAGGNVTAPAATATTQRVQPGATAASSAPPKVNIEALQMSRGEPVDLGRNPFRFRPPPAPPPPPPAPTASVGRPGNMTMPTPFGPAPPTGPPEPPPIALKFIGIVTLPDGTRKAGLTDGQAPVWGKEGEEILGRYRILKIGVESLDIAYLDGRGRRTIRLTGQ